MDSDSDEEKYYISEDTEDNEPHGLPYHSLQPQIFLPAALNLRMMLVMQQVNSHNPAFGHCPLNPEGVVHTFTGSPNGKSREAAQVTSESTPLSVLLLFFVEIINLLVVETNPSSWGLHLIVVRRFEYTEDPKSYTSGSVATGRVSHAGKVEG